MGRELPAISGRHILFKH